MATRSRIAIQNESGIVKSIYCHFDGYLSGVGETLFNHYDKEKLEKLIELGDISTLGESTEDTVAYHRDRGEDLHSTDYLNIEGLFGKGFNMGEEYIYCLTKEGTWVFRSYDEEVINLKEKLEEHKIID
jgi:hypothetical protein